MVRRRLDGEAPKSRGDVCEFVRPEVTVSCTLFGSCPRSRVFFRVYNCRSDFDLRTMGTTRYRTVQRKRLGRFRAVNGVKAVTYCQMGEN